MKTNRKLFVLGTIAGICAITGVALASTHSLTANADSTTTFQMNGASIRYSENTGIRFETLISKTEYESLTKNATTVTTGTWILPTGVLGDAELNETTAKTLQANEENPKPMPTSKEGGCEYVADGDYYSFIAYLEGFDAEGADESLLLSRYKTGICARSYVCVDGTYHYSDMITRSIGYVAQRAYNDPETTSTQKSSLQGYMNKLAGTQVEYTVNAYYQNADGSYAEAPTVSMLTAGFNETVSAPTAIEGQETLEPVGTVASGTAWLDGSLTLTQYYTRKISVAGPSETNAFNYQSRGEYINAMLTRSDSGDKAYNYLYTHDTYTQGSNYIRLEFMGKNYPGAVLFGVQDPNAIAYDGASTKSKLSGVQGVGFDTHYATGITYYLNANENSLKGNYNISSCFNRSYLCASNPDKQFVLIAGTKLDGSSRHIVEFFLYEKVSDTQLKLLDANSVTTAAAASVKTGKIMVTSEYNNGQTTAFVMYRPNTLNEVMNSLAEDYEIDGYAMTALQGQSNNLYRNTDGSVKVNLAAYGTAVGTNYNYVYSNEEYAAGENYMRIDFKGSEFMGAIMFGVQEMGAAHINRNVGVGVWLDTAATTASTRFYLREAVTPAGDKRESEAKATKLCDAYMKGDGKDKNFVLVIGTKLNENNKVAVEYWLYEKADTALNLAEKSAHTFTTDTGVCHTGKIMIMSARTKVAFTMYAPDTLANVNAKLAQDYTLND